MVTQQNSGSVGEERASVQGGPRRRIGLRADLRTAAADGLLALLLTAVVFAELVTWMRAGHDPAMVSMPDMARTGGALPYTASQAFGFAALLWSWVTILLGLSVASRVWRRWPGARRTVESLHRGTSLTVIGLTLAHAVCLLGDHMGDTPLTVSVPFAPTGYPPGQFPTALGILALYGAILFGPSYYLRHRLGARTWRWMHRFVPVVYALAVWHTLLYGSDVKAGSALFILLWAMQLPVILAFGVRLLAPARPGERLQPRRRLARATTLPSSHPATD